MKYFYNPPEHYILGYGEKYYMNHPLFNYCTLFLIDGKGLAVVQERFDSTFKSRYYSEIDPWLASDIYLNESFLAYFKEKAKKQKDGQYPVVTVRQLMWALRMKPLRKEFWEDKL